MRNKFALGEKHPKYRHGLSDTPIYGVWLSMRRRCSDPKCKAYPDYGGRGIRVCKRWQDFVAFYEDMGPSYRRGLTLERRNNDGDYTPANCTWIPRAAQASNKRNTVIIRLGDKDWTIQELSKKHGLSEETIRQRWKKNWSPDEIVAPAWKIRHRAA